MGKADQAQGTERLPGTLYMLVLRTLQAGPMHGYGIAQRIKPLSQDVLTVEEGSLYPALQRMGWVVAEWRPSENNRARYYHLARRADFRIRARHPGHHPSDPAGDGYRVRGGLGD